MTENNKQDIKNKKINLMAKKSGVVLINTIPPFLSSNWIRRLLGRYGEIKRIYLTPEDKSITKKRKKLRKIKRKKFINGWIEFSDKKIAKNVAKSLNNTQIGGNIKNKFREDLWNLKYLPGFKWQHLVDQLQYEREIKELKMREAARDAEEEEKFYLRKAAQANRKMKIESKNINNEQNEENEQNEQKSENFKKQTFKQKQIIDDDDKWVPTKKFKAFVDKLI